jgi:hypothetical protein
MRWVVLAGCKAHSFRLAWDAACGSSDDAAQSTCIVVRDRLVSRMPVVDGLAGSYRTAHRPDRARACGGVPRDRRAGLPSARMMQTTVITVGGDDFFWRRRNRRERRSGRGGRLVSMVEAADGAGAVSVADLAR